jgi:AraC-like DNA-binding protein
MRPEEINPFLRYAAIQTYVISQAPFACSYDYRIFYILSGDTHIVFEEATRSLPEGSLIYIRPGVPYYFEEKVKVIVFNFDMTREHADDTKPRHPGRLPTFDPAMIIENDPPAELSETVLVENAFDLEPLLKECVTNFMFPTPLSDAVTSSILKRLLCHIAQSERTVKNPSEALAHEIMLHIKKNYDKELSNSLISAEFGYHSYHLNKLFKDNMGTTIHQALINERVSIAKHLLRTTMLSIEDVAREVGFAERAQFCTVFKKHTGKTPGAYRGAKRNPKQP